MPDRWQAKERAWEDLKTSYELIIKGLAAIGYTPAQASDIVTAYETAGRRYDRFTPDHDPE